MSKKKGLPILLIIIAFIIGSGIVREFNFDTLKFEKPALAALYIITFLACVYIIVKDIRKKNSE
jgi:hypothetical protein